MNNSKQTILLVEDNDMLQEILSARLSMKGFHVWLASNGREGVDFAKLHIPDIILMDMSLPYLNGWEATELIRADEHTAHIPVIGLTARAMTTDRERGLQAGCNEYLTKPVDFERLLRIIKRYSEPIKTVE
ncbi:MAG: response regulator [Chloroflexota bacterium]